MVLFFYLLLRFAVFVGLLIFFLYRCVKKFRRRVWHTVNNLEKVVNKYFPKYEGKPLTKNYHNLHTPFDGTPTA